MNAWYITITIHYMNYFFLLLNLVLELIHELFMKRKWPLHENLFHEQVLELFMKLFVNFS